MGYKRILVTGSSGFIGSHIADFLEKNNYDVEYLYNPSCTTNTSCYME